MSIIFTQTETPGQIIQSGLPAIVSCTGQNPLTPITEQLNYKGIIGGTAGTNIFPPLYPKSVSRIGITYICEIGSCWKLPVGDWTIRLNALAATDFTWVSTYICHVTYNLGLAVWQTNCTPKTACTIASNVGHNILMSPFYVGFHVYTVTVTQSAEYRIWSPLDAVYICFQIKNEDPINSQILQVKLDQNMDSPIEYILCPEIYPEYKPFQKQNRIVTLR